MNENVKVIDFYKEKDRHNGYELEWGYLNPAAAAYWRLRDDIVQETVRDHFGLDRLQNLRVLEIGVGHGQELAKFSQLGIPQSSLVGIDIALHRLARAGKIFPGLQLSQQDAKRLAFPNSTFDVVCQFTCAMHASTEGALLAMCEEMARVLKPGGLIIWWDIAPARWSNVLSRRLMSLFARSLHLRLWASCALRTFVEIVSSSKRQAAKQNALPNYIQPVSKDNLARSFSGLTVNGRSAGCDYYVWERMWSRSRTIADFMWRHGWLSHHTFAQITKTVVVD